MEKLNEDNIAGITRTGIVERLKPVCESNVSSNLTSRITCEVCGKEHDGTYASGRFCSYTCSRRYSSLKGAAASAKACKEKLGIKCQCEFCGQKFDAKLDLKKHLPKCEKRVKRYHRKGQGDWTCKYCGEIFSSRRLMYDHLKNCQERLKLPLDSLGKVIGQYNRSAAGKKAIATRIAHGDKIGHPHTEETKKHLSEVRRHNLENGIGNHWISPIIKRSKAEQYFYECFINARLEFENNIWVGHYCLDFKVGNNYFEVDGEQHYTEEGIAKDKRRTDFLQKKGLNLVGRCRWSHFMKLSFEERKLYVQDIVKKLQA